MNGEKVVVLLYLHGFVNCQRIKYSNWLTNLKSFDKRLVKSINSDW